MSLNYTTTLYFINGVRKFYINVDTTHNDLNGNGVAEKGEIITPSNYEYVGTVNVAGEVYPVYEYINTAKGITYHIMAAGGDAPPMPANNDIPESLPEITAETFCLLAGTAIMLAGNQGRATVENLRIGDVIVSQDGNDVQVLWIGRQKVSTRFGFA